MDAKHIQSSVAGVVEYLRKNPSAALSTDTAAIAVLEKGLQCRVTGPGGTVIETDMPTAIGGGGTAPSPGWLMRAALAACDASMIAMRAAVEGITLTQLEVRVDSDSDDRGLVGANDAVKPGPLRVRVKIRIVSAAPVQNLKKIVAWAEEHSPVGDAVRRATPISMEIESTSN